jgi:hypothetical protein
MIVHEMQRINRVHASCGDEPPPLRILSTTPGVSGGVRDNLVGFLRTTELSETTSIRRVNLPGTMVRSTADVLDNI